MTSTNTMPAQSTVDRIFGTVLDPQTWRNLLYLFLSFPLGLVYFVTIVTFLSVGIGTAVIVVGIGILILTFGLIRVYTSAERALLRSLMATVVPEPAPMRRPTGLIDRMMSYLGDSQLWKGLVYLLVHFVFGVASFAMIMALIPASLALLMAPLTYSFIPMYMGYHEPINTFDQAVLCCSAGAILGLFSLHLLNLWAAMWKRVGAALLT
ncbi:MAG TPA: sensor domain-containing protein [Bryobacteraceae bacterium]|nr:sensor domain-containing protein [Bryobacteraceae bacterium]